MKKNQMLRKTTTERKEQIINEAINIIHHNGISSLTIRNLALKVKLTEGAIYRHFSGKDEILKGIYSRIKVEMDGLDYQLDTIDNSKQKLRAFILFHMELFESNPELSSIFFSTELFKQNTILSKSLSKMMKKRLTTLINILERGNVNSEFTKIDNETMAMMIQGYLRIIIKKWQMERFEFSLIDKGNKLYKTLVTILSK